MIHTDEILAGDKVSWRPGDFPRRYGTITAIRNCQQLYYLVKEKATNMTYVVFPWEITREGN